MVTADGREKRADGNWGESMDSIHGLKGGANIMLGGKRHSLGMSFYEPTVVENVSNDTLRNDDIEQSVDDKA
uniref:Uncharacterized protein n=1 Tax=Oryza meridionalis TaxID=40149 RepID=A0A0E0DYA9_9ORYZ